MILRRMNTWEDSSEINAPLLKIENTKIKKLSVSKVSRPSVNSLNQTLIVVSNANQNQGNILNNWRLTQTIATNTLKNVMRKNRTLVTLRRNFHQNPKLKIIKNPANPKVYIVA